MKEEKRLFANVEFNLETATQTIANLVSQNANLQQKIDKAIEYIKENDYHYMNEYALERFRNNLLEILGGKEKPKGFKSYEDYKKKEEAFINHFCKGDKE